MIRHELVEASTSPGRSWQRGRRESVLCSGELRFLGSQSRPGWWRIPVDPAQHILDHSATYPVLAAAHLVSCHSDVSWIPWSQSLVSVTKYSGCLRFVRLMEPQASPPPPPARLSKLRYYSDPPHTIPLATARLHCVEADV